MTPHERREFAYTLRQSGKSYKEISQEIGISVDWTKHLINSHQKNLSYFESLNSFSQKVLKTSPPYLGKNIVRSLTKHFGGVDKIDADKIAELGPLELLEIDGIGPKYVRYIANALESFGVIESSQEWLAPIEQDLSDENTKMIIRWLVRNVTDEDIPADTNNCKALIYNLVQLAKYGRSYKKYCNDPDQDKEIEQLERYSLI